MSTSTLIEESPISQWYGMMTQMFPDKCLTFLNYGYLDEVSNVTWLKSKDHAQKCSYGLIHHLLKDQDLTGKSILEIGSGRGGNCSYLAEYTTAKSVTGLDLCPAHTEFSNNTHTFENLNFVTGDACELPFENTTFDVIINIESSHSYPDLDKFGMEVQRTLKKDGLFIYADVMRTQHDTDLSDEEKIGFEIFSKKIDRYKEMISKAKLEIEKEENISAGVIKAIESIDGHLKHLLKALFDEKRESLPKEVTDSMDHMIHNFDHSLPKAFKTKHLEYIAWHIRNSI